MTIADKKASKVRAHYFHLHDLTKVLYINQSETYKSNLHVRGEVLLIASACFRSDEALFHEASFIASIHLRDISHFRLI